MKKIDALIIEGTEAKKIVKDPKFIVDTGTSLPFKHYLLLGELDNRKVFMRFPKNMEEWLEKGRVSSNK